MKWIKSYQEKCCPNTAIKIKCKLFSKSFTFFPTQNSQLKALFPTKLDLQNLRAVNLNSFPCFQLYISFPGFD